MGRARVEKASEWIPVCLLVPGSERVPRPDDLCTLVSVDGLREGRCGALVTNLMGCLL